MMKISVLILNYNVANFLDICLISVKEALKIYNHEIIVVDNASSDNSLEIIKKYHQNVILIENKENFGFPKGNNIGFEKVTGDYLLVLNPDVIVPENLIETILSKIELIDQGIAGCYLLDGCGHFLPESKRQTPSPWVSMTKILGLYKIFPKNKWFNQYYAMHINPNQDGQVDILVGAFMWMKTSLYKSLNGFDENCFMYADDVDLSYRSKLLNLKNVYWSNPKILHYKGESTNRDFTYIKRFNEAMQYFYNKHFKKNYLFSVLMQIISYIFVIKKSFEKPIIQKSPTNFYLYPTNSELKNIISSKLNQPIIPVNDLKKHPFKPDSCLIFNQNEMLFKDILDFMTTKTTLGLTFRIIPKDRNFMIGSDSKNTKGEVIFI